MRTKLTPNWRIMIRKKFGQEARDNVKVQIRHKALAIVTLVAVTAVVTTHFCNEQTEITVNNYGGTVSL